MTHSGTKIDLGGGEGRPRWWSLRAAQSLKPATYRCPLCRERLPALSEHVLIWPEGDRSRRRHAHTECVLRARRAGRLATEDEWRAVQAREGVGAGRSRVASRWSRLRGRLFGKD